MEFCPSSCIPPSLRKTPRSSSAGAHILHHPPASCRTCPRTGSDEDVNTILLQQPAAFREALERLYRDADGKWLGMLELLCRLILQCIQVERERERESIQSTSFAPAAVAEHGNASASGALAARENKLKENHWPCMRHFTGCACQATWPRQKPPQSALPSRSRQTSKPSGQIRASLPK